MQIEDFSSFNPLFHGERGQTCPFRFFCKPFTDKISCLNHFDLSQILHQIAAKNNCWGVEEFPNFEVCQVSFV